MLSCSLQNTATGIYGKDCRILIMRKDAIKNYLGEL